MSITITLPESYKWVALVGVVAPTVLTSWQVTKVISTRKKAGIKYPQLYAEKAECEASKDAQVYNCAQRSHANTLEYLPQIIAAILFSGIRHAIAAAALGTGWVIGRVFYTIGYTSGDPSKRGQGLAASSTLSAIGLLVLSSYSVAEMFLGYW